MQIALSFPYNGPTWGAQTVDKLYPRPFSMSLCQFHVRQFRGSQGAGPDVLVEAGVLVVAKVVFPVKEELPKLGLP